MSTIQGMLTRARRMEDVTTNVSYCIVGRDWLGAARNIAALGEIAPLVAADVALFAAREGVTNRAIADALGVTARALRGLRQEAGVR